MNRFKTRLLSAVLILMLASWPAIAAKTETKVSMYSMQGGHLLISEDTSAANTELVMTIPARDFARRLMAVQAVCSASASITVTQKIIRTITSGTADMLLPDIPLTATTSGAMYSEIHLRDTDTYELTIPAGGGGITCSGIVTEEVN